MKKRKLIIICSIVVAMLSIITAFAAYTFHKVISGESQSGEIEIVSKNFLNYQKEVNKDDYINENGAFDSIRYLAALKERNETAAKIDARDGKIINCYANERKVLYSDDLGYQYLNQLGFEFEFKASVDVYLKIEFDDSWATHKVYYSTGSVQRTYILKDKLGSKSPFNVMSDEWIYDESTNSAYYKYIIPATCKNINDENVGTKSFDFNIDSSYFYELKNNPSYREMITVDVSYNVSIVQANRAEQKWEVDFSKLGVLSTYKPQ